MLLHKVANLLNILPENADFSFFDQLHLDSLFQSRLNFRIFLT